MINAKHAVSPVRGLGVQKKKTVLDTSKQVNPKNNKNGINQNENTAEASQGKVLIHPGKQAIPPNMKRVIAPVKKSGKVFSYGASNGVTPNRRAKSPPNYNLDTPKSLRDKAGTPSA